jgi:hypothetical protein
MSVRRGAGDIFGREALEEAMAGIRWDIRRARRAWADDEVRSRWDLTPEKIELIGGKLFWTEEDRVTMLGLLLELIGADTAVRLGDPAVWREAVAHLDS